MTEQAQQELACSVHGEQMTCSPEELRTLFLFEKLTDEQLAWLCSHGHVELHPARAGLREGDPATCFYVLLEGTVVMYRRVGSDDVEVNRTSDRGVYSGAFNAYLDRVAAGLQQLGPGVRAVAFFVLDAADFAQLMHEWFPMAGAPARGAVLRARRNTQQVDRPAGAAARARLAVGGPDPRAQQPGRRRGARHGGAARAGRRDAPQAGHDRGRPVHPGDPADPGPAPGARGRAGREGARAEPDGGVRPRGRDHRLARRPRHHGRLGPGPDLRAGRPGHRLARAGRGDRRRGDAGRRAALARLHGRDRAADERDRGLHHADLHPGRRGQAVLPAGPRPVPGRRRARTAGQHAADARRQDPARRSRWSRTTTGRCPRSRPTPPS